MTRKKLFLTLALTLVLPVLVIAGEAERIPPPEPLESVDLPYSSEIALSEMESNYDLWLSAMLDGDQDLARIYEKNLMGIVNYDIMRGQEAVRAAAKQAALAEENQQAKSVDKSEKPSPLQASINHLNTKEALFRSIGKTNAFSNKYRLLGDYIGLLRKELKMPKLNLADNGRVSPESDQ